jgi:acyl-CoA thioesterase
MLSPEQILTKMYKNDPFSRWMGMERVDIGPGHCTLRMTVRKEMTNGFGIAHGVITFSLADSAFAFASNSRGLHAVSIECDINHVKAVKAGDVLTAIATEESLSKKLGIYRVAVKNQDDETVALFKGMVFRKNTEWIMDNG